MHRGPRPAGQEQLLGNGAPIWFPSSRVIPPGAIKFGGGATSDSPTSPGMVTPMESLAGGAANPGASVSLISTGTPTYTVSGAG